MPPYTIHSLLHFFASIMHARGVPDKYVIEMGGWVSNYVMKNFIKALSKIKSQKFRRSQTGISIRQSM